MNKSSIENYTHTIEAMAPVNKVYNALTREIPLWWTEMFEGSSLRVDDLFTIRFGNNIHKTMLVKELIVGSTIIWSVEDSLIALPELKNQTEWVGTTIVWEIEQEDDISLIKVTHIGLNPNIECYDICSNGWVQFLGSLKQFIETGKGNPYKE
nr:SRPBCC domain-containing protein [uncultured Chryseobacterium sp.]